jgi:hypothetical protein
MSNVILAKRLYLVFKEQFALTKVPKLCSKSLYKEDKQKIKTDNIVIKNKPAINFILK